MVGKQVQGHTQESQSDEQRALEQAQANLLAVELELKDAPDDGRIRKARQDVKDALQKLGRVQNDE